MGPTDVQLEFCDLCSQSIPALDLQEGRAARVGTKRVCAACRALLPREPAPGRDSPPRPRLPLTLASLMLSVLAVVAVVLSAVQSRRESQELRARVATVDPAQSERVKRLQRQLDGIEGKLERWFDEQWSRRESAAGSGGAEPTNGPLPDLAPLQAALDELADSSASERAALEQRLAGLEAQLRMAQALAGPASAPAAAPLDDLPAERRARLDLLRSAEPARRARALLELMAVPNPDDAPLAAGLLRDPDAFVRVAAARYLEGLGVRSAAGPLIDALADPDPTVRAAADSALRTLTGQAFLFDPWAPEAPRAIGLAEWRAWWASAWREFLFAPR